MPKVTLKLLLDEHYPGWLAAQLTSAGVDAEAVVFRDDLRGVDDITVLSEASVAGRVVVTEDVTTFSLAIAAVPDHAGVIFCHSSRFQRTRAGLTRLQKALQQFATQPPAGIRGTAFVWWLSE